MGRTLSVDLRERAVQAYEDGDGTKEEIAAMFRIGTATLTRWTRRWRERGDYGNDNHLTGRTATLGTPENVAKLKEILDTMSDLTYAELAEAWSSCIGAKVSRSLTVKWVIKLGYTLKKKPSGRASGTSSESRRSARGTRTGSRARKPKGSIL